MIRFADSIRQRYVAEEIEKLGKNNISADIFTFHDLSVATKNFDTENLVGEGGFGRVYKGRIVGRDKEVAVKQLDRDGFQGNREFLVEVMMLSLLHHQNLVNLVGYCSEGDQRILVYDYMPNGSLEDHLLSRHYSILFTTTIVYCIIVLATSFIAHTHDYQVSRRSQI